MPGRVEMPLPSRAEIPSPLATLDRSQQTARQSNAGIRPDRIGISRQKQAGGDSKEHARYLVTRVLRWEATRPTGMPKYGYREIDDLGSRCSRAVHFPDAFQCLWFHFSATAIWSESFCIPGRCSYVKSAQKSPRSSAVASLPDKPEDKPCTAVRASGRPALDKIV